MRQSIQNSLIDFSYTRRKWAMASGKTGMFLVMVVFLSSCEKVINVKLDDAAKKYVIEGIVTNAAGITQVKLSQTLNFADDNNFSGVSGAIVTIKDNQAPAVTLTESSAGIYQASSVNGTIGHTYELNVKINNEVFTAVAQMPEPVNFDSLYVEDFNGFGSPTKFASVIFKDPPGKGNAYHFIQYKNGSQNKTIFILDDNFSDGRINNILLVNFQNNDTDDEIKSGDSIRVDMQCVDLPVYNYWYSLDQGSTGANNNATPGNPVSNISGGALGYFSAHTVQTKSVLVP